MNKLGFACLLLLVSAEALAEPFTYQGKLDDTTGLQATYDFQFRLLDGPDPFASTIIATAGADDVSVNNGYFTVELDFGTVFDGTPYWLEVNVRPGNSTGNYTSLAPTQPIQATPEAQVSLLSLSAAAGSIDSAAIIDGSITAADTDNSLQKAINNSCGNNQSIQAIAADGSVTCETDDDTTYSAGNGLSLDGNSHAFSVDTSAVQARVGGSCPSGSSIASIAADGSVSCETDDTGADWSLGGNTLNGTEWLGSSNDRPLVFVVNGQPAMRLVPTVPDGTGLGPNIVSGWGYNRVSGGVIGGTVAGGGGHLSYRNCGDGTEPCVNRVSASFGTVSGGWGNFASGFASVVSGGRTNTASGTYAMVLGGRYNRAGGAFSLAAGYAARVRNATEVGGGDTNGDEGTFVWSDSSVNGVFTSTGPNQFLIRARGGMGVGTNAPENQLHVVEQVAGTASSPGSHVMQVENTSTDTGLSGDVLALVLSGVNNPGGASNYITFYEKDGADANSDPDPIAAIEGNGAGGVVYKTSGADFAEYLPAETDFAPGSVVGLKQGRLVADVRGAEKVLVISSAPALVGNADMNGNRGRALAALLGQVPVNVVGKVAAGDWLLATGDGRARALGGDELAEVDLRRVVGKALSADENGQAMVLVGLPPQEILAMQQLWMRRQQQQVAELSGMVRELAAAVYQQQQELARLRQEQSAGGQPAR